MTNASPIKSRTSHDTLMLLRAVDEGDAERVKSLLAAGADANATSETNETVLMRAVSKGHLQVVHILLDAGSDVHARSENGFTPLFMAVFFGYADIARALLARGSDPAAPTRVNTTAEQWARSWGSAEIVELLNEADAARAQASAAEHVTTGVEKAETTHAFFPADGQFRSVVPLSEIGSATVTAESTSAVNAVDAEAAPRGNERVEAARLSTNGRGDEQDETTLVPTRTSPAPLPRPLPIVRQNWPVTAAALVLSVVAGLIVGLYLIEARQPSGTQVSGSQSTTATSVPQSSQPAPQPPASEPAPAPVAPVAAAGKAAGKAVKVDGDEFSLKTAPPPTDTAGGRAHEAEQPARRAVIAEARLERPARTAVESVERSPAAKPAQRDAAAPRARVAQERSPASTPAAQSLPVSSPPPSAKSRKVIQWP